MSTTLGAVFLVYLLNLRDLEGRLLLRALGVFGNIEWLGALLILQLSRHLSWVVIYFTHEAASNHLVRDAVIVREG